MKHLWIVLALVAAPVSAQDHTALVAQVKAEVVAKGLDVSTPCGGFAVTARVAWALRSEGAGVLQKIRAGVPDGDSQSPYGCGVGGTLYAYDAIIYPDGHHFDVLTGTDLAAQWRLVKVEGTEAPYLRPESYHIAIDPGDAVVPDSGVNVPVVGMQGPKGDKGDPGEGIDPVLLAEIKERLTALETRVSALEARPVLVSCSAVLNIGVARIPVTCRLEAR